MVPALDTVATQVAVLGAWRCKYLTSWADVIRMKLLKQVHDFELLIIFILYQIAWVLAGGHEEGTSDDDPNKPVKGVQ